MAAMSDIMITEDVADLDIEPADRNPINLLCICLNMELIYVWKHSLICV